MKTKQNYLENSYLKTMTATVLAVSPEAAGRWKVILSETVFYPMGGGQSTDQGRLFSNDWEGKVYQVQAKDGEIFHYIEASSPPETGMVVTGEIDWQRRYHNMKLHSAGHIVDFAMYLLGYSPNTLIPLKADHGKKPTIWYQGVLDHDILKELEAKANFLVAENLIFSTRLASSDELKDQVIYLQPNLPTNKQLRMLTLEKVGSVADGGTQVHRTGEVGEISIISIEGKEGLTIVRYAIQDKEGI
jgi:Ser-tRNA(Ala) deacylase AlaX